MRPVPEPDAAAGLAVQIANQFAVDAAKAALAGGGSPISYPNPTNDGYAQHPNNPSTLLGNH